MSSSLAGGVPASRGAFNGQLPVGRAGTNHTAAPSSQCPVSVSPESVRGVWHMPHIATSSTMYFPCATRLSLDPVFAVWGDWLFARGRPLTVRVASPRMTIIHESDRSSCRSILKNRIGNSLELDVEYCSRVDVSNSESVQHQAGRTRWYTPKRPRSQSVTIKILEIVKKCTLKPQCPQKCGVYCEEVRTSYRGKCFYGVERSPTLAGPGSGR